MASTDTSTSSQISHAATEEHKRIVDEAFLNKLKGLVERLRLDNATLKKSLDIERSEVRALKARHESTIRNLKTESKKKEEQLEKQLRTVVIPERVEEPLGNNKMVELKRLTTEIQSLKAANKGLQEKLKVAQAAECARAAELRAQVAKHNALEQAARRDARAQCHKLLEEIKSKERVIIQLKREAARAASHEQAQRMECGTTDFCRKRGDQAKEKSNREDLKTDIQHRKETSYREVPSDGDSAVSSAPASLSPQPLNDMWSCGQCRSAAERAAAAARECTRLADALRDARDQLELMEFRLLELEDAAPDKGARDNLTDSDSGCVSPGSRIKDSASPELKRMDSGYKSPHMPSSPNPRRHLTTPHDDFKEDFAKAQVLADILDRNSETGDSLKSNPVKDHLEQMILNAASAEDRGCLEQVLMMLYNFQALSSSVSEDECYQTKPRRISDLRLKSDIDIPSHKTHKAIATVTPYQQKGYKSESLESLCEERKPNNILQESGIFEGVETECKSTQTDINDNFEYSGELNTEIQRLNSIREKLEKQGVRNRTLSKEDGDSLECKCVKLGKKHKQYYERRLKFLEGKISIYEAAQDVKEAKLAQRLQKEFLLENKIQELESQLLDLQDKYERLEEECCELEEIENDTRLHWQQLEMDYELCSAQLRDMTEQRECSRAQAERLMAELTKRECTLKARENELLSRLEGLEKAVPALIAWNVLQAVGATISTGGQYALMSRMGPLSTDTKEAISQLKRDKQEECGAIAVFNDMKTLASPATQELQRQITMLIKDKKEIEKQTEQLKRTLEKKIKDLEEELETTRRQIAAAVCGAEYKKEKLEQKIVNLEDEIEKEKDDEKLPPDPLTASKIQALLHSEQELKNRIAELERRETAYLEMLTQADDMWAEMEGGYKKKIAESVATETQLKGKVKKLEAERDQWKNCFEPLKKKLREVEESESGMRIALEKAERDTKALKSQNTNLVAMFGKADADAKKAETTVKALENKFKREIDQLRKMNKQLDEDLKSHRELSKKTEVSFMGDLDCIRKELTRACKNNQELEVTNSELKEEEWQRAVSSMTFAPAYACAESVALSGNAGVVRGAARLASVSCACAAARLCAASPELADTVKICQEEVLEHGDVKIMEEQLANAIESIVNCPSCALGTNAIVWSTDV
ncbi:axoneme-associated protein mst101(2)-like isoform X2 [Maniola jurtina]|uniref:axoneme-associated protein mst101(2)-like isoform X2 n=1 Tax=Maniola jurtina TaxID=191418 RepID=UPI001E68B925|nr:axoneme-associated protein mst101(2)-like isoform X2 [Maniola jurtina]